MKPPKLCLLLLLLRLLPETSAAGQAEALRRAPHVIEVDRATLPRAECIATPKVRTLVGYTRRVLHLRDGRTLAVFSYSNAAAANWLFLIDSRDLTSKRYSIPNNDIASHSSALASDGNIYIMPYGTPRAYRFDVTRTAFAPITVEGLPPAEYTWDAIGGRDGQIYFGTYPNACLGRYDIATGRTKVWPQVAPSAKYVTDFALDGEGVRFKAWGPDEVWMRVDAESAEPVQIQVSPPATAPAIQRIEKGEPTWIENAAGAEISIGHYGSLARRDPATGAVTTRGRLDNLAPGGNAIMFLEAVTPDCVIGANYSQQHLFRVNPRTGAVVTSDEMVARTTGQPMCAVALSGQAYIGIYIRAIISMFDPAEPFAFEKNPREIGELFTRHHQTRPSDAVTDGRRVYVATEGDYSRLGGALAVIDPGTQRLDAYPQLVKDQNLTTLAHDSKSKLLWGGTDRWGQMRSAGPTQESAAIFAFDPAARKVVATLTPWKGADRIDVLGCTDDGVLVAAGNGRIAMIDTQTRQTLHEGRWPVSPSRKLRRGADGRMYLLGDGTLFRWDDHKNELAPVAIAPECTFLTEPSPGLWLLADATSVYRVRLAP